MPETSIRAVFVQAFGRANNTEGSGRRTPLEVGVADKPAGKSVFAASYTWRETYTSGFDSAEPQEVHSAETRRDITHNCVINKTAAIIAAVIHSRKTNSICLSQPTLCPTPQLALAETTIRPRPALFVRCLLSVFCIFCSPLFWVCSKIRLNLYQQRPSLIDGLVSGLRHDDFTNTTDQTSSRKRHFCLDTFTSPENHQ